MLELDGLLFTQGRARYADRHPERPEPSAKIYVRVRFAQSSYAVLAQLDTGAAWSVLPPDIARDVQVEIDSGLPEQMSTRWGVISGFLVRVPFTLPADEGLSFVSMGTFFISEDWPEGQTFLGYSGLLDSIRFALDPQRNDFYFGSS